MIKPQSQSLGYHGVRVFGRSTAVSRADRIVGSRDSRRLVAVEMSLAWFYWEKNCDIQHSTAVSV